MNQEYYYNGGYVVIVGGVEGEEDLVVVNESNSYGGMHVARRSELVKKEESYTFKQAEKRKKELEAITKKAQDNLDKLADKVVDKALISLSSRMKFNVAFGKDMSNSAGWALMVADELKKMVKEKTPEMMKELDL